MVLNTGKVTTTARRSGCIVSTILVMAKKLPDMHATDRGPVYGRLTGPVCD